MRSAAEKRKMLELFDAFVYVKDFISLIIFTVPRLIGVAKFFRDIATWSVQVEGGEGNLHEEGSGVYQNWDIEGNRYSGDVLLHKESENAG